MEEFIFDSTIYKKLLFYWKGWRWGFAIMLIEDNNGEEKIRLAKCRIAEDFPKTTMYEWEQVPLYYINSLNQSNKINFKTKDNLDDIFEMLEIELNELKSQ
jgi:hypothetical protein